LHSFLGSLRQISNAFLEKLHKSNDSLPRRVHVLNDCEHSVVVLRPGHVLLLVHCEYDDGENVGLVVDLRNHLRAHRPRDQQHCLDVVLHQLLQLSLVLGRFEGGLSGEEAL